MSDIEQAIKVAAEKAVLHFVSEGGWVMPDYNSRIKLPPDFMQDIWNMVDREKIKKAMAHRLEEELADRIVNHMAAEIATDIKQILSVQERREKLRAIVREHMDEIVRGT
jgi:hypothetical protein